jgi:pyruvate formate lyase activating enzyme
VIKEAVLFEKLSHDYVRCHVCQWRCKIAPEKLGLCRVRQNKGGILFSVNYASPSSIAVDPVEKKPLFHFYPGTSVFSLGSWGCNFQCKHCQNWEISCAYGLEKTGFGRELSPEKSVDMALQQRCSGIAWTYNEPTIWFEHTFDSARLAKSRNLYTVYVTNGFITPEALDFIGPYLEAFRVDIKGFTDDFYYVLSRVSRWRGILDVTVRAKEKWGMHVEVVTNVIPTLNDDENQLRGIASWINKNLGDLTPWHITRFHPDYLLRNLPSTPMDTMEKAYRWGKEEGLKFIYLGNVPGNERENTTCYSCGKKIVQRTGDSTLITGLKDSRCASCGAEANFRL